IEIVVVWDAGEDHFFTGLKPELGQGYADFTMTEGVSYTLRLAEPFTMSEPLRIELGHGALLHDIGKIGVSDAILLKPGKLTPEEWVEMRKHPQIGFDILGGIEFLQPAAEIVLTHQERFDGTGYPRGLAGEKIPLGARIFSVVDTLDAMTSDRPYRKALAFERAFEEIRTYSGKQFDPEVVEAFFSIPSGEWSSIRAGFSGLSSPRVLQAH
ncbi:MAG: HD-GYP domain-containing protein, partial [Nitrospirae bacterium]|nr:HD-GYP domain-containing protein [Nitrospirota bacterium]